MYSNGIYFSGTAVRTVNLYKKHGSPRSVSKRIWRQGDDTLWLLSTVEGQAIEEPSTRSPSTVTWAVQKSKIRLQLEGTKLYLTRIQHVLVFTYCSILENRSHFIDKKRMAVWGWVSLRLPSLVSPYNILHFSPTVASYQQQWSNRVVTKSMNALHQSHRLQISDIMVSRSYPNLCQDNEPVFLDAAYTERYNGLYTDRNGEEAYRVSVPGLRYSLRVFHSCLSENQPYG